MEKNKKDKHRVIKGSTLDIVRDVLPEQETFERRCLWNEEACKDVAIKHFKQWAGNKAGMC